MVNKIKTLAEVLPEGLSEEVVTEIAGLLRDLIDERVDEELSLLTTKVHAFLRQHMDKIQETAMNELAETDTVYRDAQSLQNIKAVLAFDIDREDLQHVAEQVNEDVAKVQEDNSILASELADVITEKDQAQRALGILKESHETLTGEKDTLQDQVTELEAEADEDFESSERAVIIKENEDTEEKISQPEIVNEFLTPEVMRLSKA